MNDWLIIHTNRDVKYWIHRVEQLIAAHSTPAATEDTVDANGEVKELSGHGSTNMAWIPKLFQEIFNCMPPISPTYGLAPYDENMRVAALGGYILSAWYSTVQQAKCFDKNRPQPVRQVAYHKFSLWRRELIEDLHDLQLLTDIFAAQQWQHPFDPHNAGGNFL